MLLSVMAGEFSHIMRTEVNITRNFKEETQAYYLAEAGIYRAIFELIRTEAHLERLNPAEHRDSSEWRINTEIAPVRFAQGRFHLKIDNESGKIDLNAADEATIRLLLGRFALDEQQKNIIADSIADWRDSDNNHRLNGAENEYYQSLGKPYSCKNADFDSVEELLLVRGVSEEIFYGGLKDMLTVYRGESLKDRKPVFGIPAYVREEKKRKVNINAGSPEMLRLFPPINEVILEKIMEYRKNKDFESEEEIGKVLGIGVQTALAPYITVEKSAFFTITSVGKPDDSEVIQAIQVLVEIDPALEKKYRMVRWTDRYDISKYSQH